jgi:hypothetical protein
MSEARSRGSLVVAVLLSTALVAALLLAADHFLKSRPPAAPPPTATLAEPAREPPPPAGRILATVVDESGRALEGARVSCYGAEGLLSVEAASDAGGTAVLDGLPPGDYTLSGVLGGLISHEPVTASLAAGQAAEARIVLRPGLRFEGRVTSGKAPLPEACVSINASGKASRYACVLSSADGAFSFEPLAPGKYILTVARSGFRTERLPWLVLGPKTPVAAVTVELRPLVKIAGSVLDTDGRPVPGAALDVYRTEDTKKKNLLSASSFQNIELPPPVTHPRLIASGHLGILKGPVPDFPDTPSAGAATEPLARAGEEECPCMASLRESEAPVSTTTDAAGLFTLLVDPSASFHLVVSHPGYAPRKLEGLDPAGTAKGGNLIVTLEAGREIQGRLADLAGLPPAGAQLWMDMEDFFIIADVPVEADGSFVLPRAAGTVALHANAPGFSPEIKRIVVEAVPQGQAVEITLVPEELTLAGRVVDWRGYPIEGAAVLVRMATKDQSAAARKAVSDADGMFGFAVLPPGEWLITIDHPSCFTLEQRVIEWEGEKEFALLAAGGLCGTVLDDRTYLAAPAFSLSLASDKNVSAAGDFSGGTYRWTDLPAGRGTLTITAEGYAPQTRDIDIPPAEIKGQCTAQDVDFWLVPTGP